MQKRSLDLDKIAKQLQKQFPDLGFFVMVFDINKDEQGDERVNYMSNLEEPDMIKYVKNFTNSMEAQNDETQRH